MNIIIMSFWICMTFFCKTDNKILKYVTVFFVSTTLTFLLWAKAVEKYLRKSYRFGMT